MRLRNAFKDCAFEASKLVSTKTLLLKHDSRHQGETPFQNPVKVPRVKVAWCICIRDAASALIESSKVPEGHYPRAQRSARLSEEICLSEGSAGVSSLRGLCGVSPRVLQGRSEGSAGLCRGPRDFPRFFGGSDP